ncbi:MAG: hypothetical protein ABR921_12790 [Candidatus Sulfotelmatobacter sp.]|jgi:hypothetical protein
MRARRSFASLWIAALIAGILCAACFGAVDQPKAVSTSTSTTISRNHRKAAKKPPLPPLPSGPRGPVPQIALDSMQAVAPHVTYENGQLTIVAPNSTLADILRAVRKLTGAEMDIPANATERVVTNLGPGPAPGVVAELLNGSHFNYVLLGAPSDANTLTRVVLVAKSGPDTTAPGAGVVANAASPQQAAQGGLEAADADATDDSDDSADQNAAEAAEPQQPAPGDTAVKTPQQLLQEMQQRQLQIQQQQQAGGGQPGQPPTPGAGIIPPQRGPQQQPPQQPPDQ